MDFILSIKWQFLSVNVLVTVSFFGIAQFNRVVICLKVDMVIVAGSSISCSVVTVLNGVHCDWRDW